MTVACSTSRLPVVERAHVAAAQAAEHAGIRLVRLDSSDAFVAASALLARVWGTPLAESPLPSDLLASFAHSGACLLGARVERTPSVDDTRGAGGIGIADGDLVGVAVGIGGPPHSAEVYSLIAASVADVAGRGVGAALKYGQRAWGLDRGAERMVWTFDPLVRRNAHFNIGKLGARATEYRMDFYPPMHDAINREDLTDRLVAEWDLTRPSAAESPDLAAGPGIDGAVEILGIDPEQRPLVRELRDGAVLRVSVPADIERLRLTDPTSARAWRLALREVLAPRLAAGYRITGFSADGAYLLMGA